MEADQVRTLARAEPTFLGFIVIVPVLWVFAGCSTDVGASAESAAENRAPASIAVPQAAPSPVIIVTFPQLNEVALFDPATASIKQFIAVPGGPTQVIADPSHGTAYVVVNGGSGISVVNIGSLRVDRTIAVPDGCQELTINDDGSKLYALGGQSVVSVIIIALGQVVTTVTISGAAGMALSGSTHQLFVSTPESHEIVPVDTRTDTVGHSFYGGDCLDGPCDPAALMTSVDGDYLLGSGEGGFVAINATTKKVVLRQSNDGFHRLVQFIGIDKPANLAMLLAPSDGFRSSTYSMHMDPPFDNGPYHGSLGNRNVFVAAAFDESGTIGWVADAYREKLWRLPFTDPPMSVHLNAEPYGMALVP
jgi:DNA-binding beta-propeller fold protein YncE